MSGETVVGLSIVACCDISGGYGEQNGKFGSGSRLEFGRLQAMKSVSDPPSTNALSRQGCSRLRGIITIWTPADIDSQALLLLQHVSRLQSGNGASFPSSPAKLRMLHAFCESVRTTHTSISTVINPKAVLHQSRFSKEQVVETAESFRRHRR